MYEWNNIQASKFKAWTEESLLYILVGAWPSYCQRTKKKTWIIGCFNSMSNIGTGDELIILYRNQINKDIGKIGYIHIRLGIINFIKLNIKKEVLGH